MSLQLFVLKNAFMGHVLDLIHVNVTLVGQVYHVMNVLNCLDVFMEIVLICLALASAKRDGLVPYVMSQFVLQVAILKMPFV